MHIQSHKINNHHIAELLSDDILIGSAEDGLNLLGELYYEGYEAIIINEKNIVPWFFDLENRMAGEILQKFSNYRMKLAIVGDFSKYKGKSIRDFIYESNKGRQINFVSSQEEALKLLSSV